MKGIFIQNIFIIKILFSWNTSSPLKSRSEQPDSPIKTTNNDKNIIGLERFMQHSNGESNNGNKIQNEDKNKNEEEQNKEEDKDFRQFWSSIEIKQKNIEEEKNTNKSPPQLTKIISSPPPLPPSRPTSSAEIKNLPSLLDLNLTPPPSSSIHPPPSSSVKPFSFFGGQFGNNVKTANYGQTQKQSSPIRPFFNICPETPINVQQQQQELLSKGERIINIL
ncbi:unnamed protein product [Meloidogyne enterolobii]|uniref:Uncharacterized protein n=1 Tax=Meloidogyne enterolobii TaxID=390850 RepID=A0ACB0XP58_MELEN